jgi:peptide-methionine (R)-S-oxide reductase
MDHQLYRREPFAMISRRQLGLISFSVLLGAVGIWRASLARGTQKGMFEITKTDEEWKRILTPQQYYVLRTHGTEAAFSSSLDKHFAAGTYHCAGCDLPLFSSDTKYDSGTGWPSFWRPLDDAIGTSEDRSLFTVRTEVHCRRCGSHLGHVFEDGPPPTGLRYCMNGIALKFVPRPSS